MTWKLISNRQPRLIHSDGADEMRPKGWYLVAGELYELAGVSAEKLPDVFPWNPTNGNPQAMLVKAGVAVADFEWEHSGPHIARALQEKRDRAEAERRAENHRKLQDRKVQMHKDNQATSMQSLAKRYTHQYRRTH